MGVHSARWYEWEDGTAVKCQDFKYGVSRTYATDVISGGPTYAIQYLAIPTKADGSSKYPGPYMATAAQQTLFDKAVVCSGNTITFHLNRPVPDFNYTVTLGFGAVPNPVIIPVSTPARRTPPRRGPTART